MTTLEAPPIEDVVLTEDTEDVDEFLCHVYRFIEVIHHEERAVCGLPQSQDEHRKMHLQYGQGPRPMQKDDTKCSKCGTPICPTCLAIVRKAMGW